MQINKPYSESCDQNKEPILEVIQPLFKDIKSALEVGSGTGQHAVYFAEKMPHLMWQTSDQQPYHDGINRWLADAKLPNTPAPIALNVSSDSWPKQNYDAVFSANAVHIMAWENVVDFFENAPKLLSSGGLFILYGPFNYHQQYTSESNARFDVWLKQRDPQSAIRDFEALDKLANNAGMKIKEDYALPANNRILVWEKL
ncbi:MAG: class I SAM-dependent methyltransferase [Cocleimonas sp.]|nr:class I SAM-dependent methyltransferase [Cocleimonas sp.]